VLGLRTARRHEGPRERKSASELIVWLLVWLMLVLLVGAIGALVWSQLSRPSSLTARLGSLTHEQLESERLRQEILNLQGNRSFLATLATNAAIVVGVLGIIVTAVRYIDERRQQRIEDARQAAAGREQRKEDALRRFDEKFRDVVMDLGSQDPLRQTNAALSILPFLKEEYRAFYNQIIMVLLAILRMQKVADQDVNKTVVWVFQRALRAGLESRRNGQRGIDISPWPEPVPLVELRVEEETEELDLTVALDLSRLPLDGIDLSQLDMHGADFSFASLKRANLRGANLERARGYAIDLEEANLQGASLVEARLRKGRLKRAIFHGANLVSSRLDEADLRGASFFQAKLQSAHFNGADLSGARFDQADINDTQFRGTLLDTAAIHSLTRARNWTRARFDASAQALLEESV
jgi:uncharacterized protein YjbI with pentapeptide repeats